MLRRSFPTHIMFGHPVGAQHAAPSHMAPSLTLPRRHGGGNYPSPRLVPMPLSPHRSGWAIGEPAL